MARNSGGQNWTERGERTRAIHAGEVPDSATGASSPNITMSSTFVTEGPAGFSAHDLTDESPYLYGRWSNPTVRMLERKMAALEGTEAAVCFASGMGAMAAIFFSTLSSGDHLLVSDVSYAGVAELARETLPRMGVEVSTVDFSDLDAVKNAIRPNTKLLHSEMPVNPILRLVDLQALSDVAHEAGALHSFDATFASPIGLRPSQFGVDLVMHSLTKYVGGHGDALGGSVAGSTAHIKRLVVEAALHYGGIISPFNAWLIARGAATLPLRMRAHQETAMAVSNYLEEHAKVERVIYPGLPSHPQYDLAQRQMNNYSGMVSFQLKGGAEAGLKAAERMAQRLDVIHYAVSLGHHRSLIFWMPTDDLMESSFKLTGSALESYRSLAGEGIFRFSVGLEDAEDLIADLDAIFA